MRKVNLIQWEYFLWVRIYTTNVGIHGLLYGILDTLHIAVFCFKFSRGWPLNSFVCAWLCHKSISHSGYVIKSQDIYLKLLRQSCFGNYNVVNKSKIEHQNWRNVRSKNGHWCSVGVGKSQPSRQLFQWEKRQATFHTGTMDPSVGIFQTPLDTNHQSSILLVSIRKDQRGYLMT